MPADINPLAGKPAPPSMLVNVPRLVTAYFAGRPDPKIPAQRVAFGTSGHRGSAFNNAFNEAHILSISQAICDHRARSGISGPLFVGIDTHALAEPAFASALEVFAANGVDVMIDEARRLHADAGDLARDPHLQQRPRARPCRWRRDHAVAQSAGGWRLQIQSAQWRSGRYRYHLAIERAANAFLENDLEGVKRIPYDRARKSPNVHRHDYIGPYVADLADVVDMEAIRASGVKIGIDPLGGAGVHYWQPIIERYGLAATIVNDAVDPTFRFMTLDWDGKIRMDCSSPYAMARLIGMRDKFDVAFANDTDADRHGIVTRSGGLMNPNHYLAAAIAYLFEHRPGLERQQRGRQDHCQQRDHRPRRQKARPRAGRNAGGIQMVRRWPQRRVVRVRRRGKRRGLVPAARRVGVDHRQGRHHFGAAGRRDDRADAAATRANSSTA